MIRRMVSMIALVSTLYFAFNYRYRIVNLLLSKRWIRRVAVWSALQIPYVRDNFLGSVFRFSEERTPQYNR